MSERARVIGTIEIIVPGSSDDLISEGLRSITKAISTTGVEMAMGLFGGSYGYGAEYKNPVFEMFPYFWGECECGHQDKIDNWDDANSHAETCYQHALEMERKKAGLRHWECDSSGKGYAVEANINRTYDESRAIEDEIYSRLLLRFNLPRRGCAVHCTCSHDFDRKKFMNANPHAKECGVERPNFRHEASGFEVRWYKYIGRDNQFNREISDSEWLGILTECLNSIKTTTATGSPS